MGGRPRVFDLNPCIEPGCDRSDITARGLCTTHYARLRKTLRQCEVEGCDKGVSALGVCAIVYGNRKARYCGDCRAMWHQLRHGLSAEQAREVRREGGTCAICFRVRPLHVDHDHDCCDGPTSCGKCIRGFICGPCNTGMGMLDDHYVLAMRAAVYLLAYRANGDAAETSRRMASLTESLLGELAHAQ